MESTAIPTPTSSSPPSSNFTDVKQFDERILSREVVVSSTSNLRDSYDQAVRTDTGSTFATDTGQRHELIRSIVEKKEYQEVSEAETAGAAQGGHSGIMGAGAYHANDIAAGTAMKGVDVERPGVTAFAGVANEGTELASSRHPFTKNVNNNRDSSSKSRLLDYEPQKNNSPPSPTSQSYKDFPQSQNRPHSSYTSKFSSESYRKNSVEGASASSFSLSSSTASPHFSAGTSDSLAPSTITPSSPSMNNHPVSFDPTDQSHHLPFYTNNASVNSSNTSSLNNKRRSLADLLFVPTKSIKIKEKRNSFSASSVSSVESYRQDEPYTGRPTHPKSASTPSTTSTPPVSSNQKMPLDTHPSPPARKSSTTKGGKGGSGSTSSPKTFQCTGYPGCNMVFTRSEHLARHE
ncbi:hypothetical protein BGZ76_010247, partial [Entomortierella beljakovae]